MKLNEVKWKAVHFKDRTILNIDRPLFPPDTWAYLTNCVEVEEMNDKGHFRALQVW